MAVKHADKLMEHFIRPDGSVRHIVEFDPMTGVFRKDYGGQGYAHGSSWTRGQAWALYGFMLSYVHTGREAYLDAAKRVANYFIANISEDGLIPVDFRQPKEPVYYDDTAAAVASCGLIEVARQVTGQEKRSIQQSSSAYHSPKHNHTLVYADCFFLEALLKLNGEEIPLW